MAVGQNESVGREHHTRSAAVPSFHANDRRPDLLDGMNDGGRVGVQQFVVVEMAAGFSGGHVQSSRAAGYGASPGWGGHGGNGFTGETKKRRTNGVGFLKATKITKITKKNLPFDQPPKATNRTALRSSSFLRFSLCLPNLIKLHAEE